MIPCPRCGRPMSSKLDGACLACWTKSLSRPRPDPAPETAQDREERIKAQIQKYTKGKPKRLSAPPDVDLVRHVQGEAFKLPEPVKVKP